jgi:hypothetical protein
MVTYPWACLAAGSGQARASGRRRLLSSPPMDFISGTLRAEGDKIGFRPDLQDNPDLLLQSLKKLVWPLIRHKIPSSTGAAKALPHL